MSLFYSSLPPPSKENIGQARPFSRGAPWRSPGKSPYSEKELEHQELSPKGLFILLFSENHFLPCWGISVPKYKLPSKEITTSRLIPSCSVSSMFG